MSNYYKVLGSIVFPSPRLPIVLYWAKTSCNLEPGVFVCTRGYYAVDHELHPEYAFYLGAAYPSLQAFLNNKRERYPESEFDGDLWRYIASKEPEWVVLRQHWEAGESVESTHLSYEAADRAAMKYQREFHRLNPGSHGIEYLAAKKGESWDDAQKRESER